MDGDREIAARGEVRGEDVGRSHATGFERALDRALADLDGHKYAGQELELHQFVVITPNPGGVGQYVVHLSPSG